MKLKLHKNQNGDTHLMIFLALGFVLIAGLVAFRVSQAGDPPVVPNQLPSQSSQSGELESDADVKKASDDLDATDVDSSVNPSQLDEDIESLE